MITRFFYPPSDKEACGDRCNESRCIFLLSPSHFHRFPSLLQRRHPPGEIIVLITSDNDDDVNEEFFMADACLYGHTVRPLQAVMRAAEAEYLTTHLPTEVDTIVAVVSYTDSLLGLSTPRTEQTKVKIRTGPTCVPDCTSPNTGLIV